MQLACNQNTYTRSCVKKIALLERNSGIKTRRLEKEVDLLRRKVAVNENNIGCIAQCTNSLTFRVRAMGCIARPTSVVVFRNVLSAKKPQKVSFVWICVCKSAPSPFCGGVVNTTYTQIRLFRHVKGFNSQRKSHPGSQESLLMFKTRTRSDTTVTYC